MRTALIIVGGYALWALSLGTARLTGDSSGWGATLVFLVVWFGVAAVNMWFGVAKAGYSFSEELPVFLLIFLVPSLVAVIVKWKFL